jgi:hypothetical protein
MSACFRETKREYGREICLVEGHHASKQHTGMLSHSGAWNSLLDSKCCIYLHVCGDLTIQTLRAIVYNIQDLFSDNILDSLFKKPEFLNDVISSSAL